MVNRLSLSFSLIFFFFSLFFFLLQPGSSLPRNPPSPPMSPPPPPPPPLSLLLLFLLLLLLLLLPFPSSSSSSSSSIFAFDFPSFSLRNLTLLGSSSLLLGSISLTHPPSSSSSAAAVLSLPVPFADPATNASASFSTAFAFSITNPSPNPTHGDGLAFFLARDPLPFGAPGLHLGLFNASAPPPDPPAIVAVEFDTLLDERFNDPSPNHVGFDVATPESLVTADLGSHGLNLTSGNSINAWIDYSQGDQTLNVSISYASEKPQIPILSARFDLAAKAAPYMFMGFSASAAEGSGDVHTVESWSFRAWGLPGPNLKAGPTHSVTRPMSRPQRNPHSNKKLSIGLGVVGPAAAGVALMVFVCLSLRKKNIEINGKDKKSSATEIANRLRLFRYTEIYNATRGFHSNRIIGEGGFGTVYKFVSPETGATYAVKRSMESEKNRDEFAAELSIIIELKHENLVQLQGWCTEHEELLIVYEFMPNGSLDKVLYPLPDSRAASPVLNWARRYNVAVGIASVLTYLHQECNPQVIHRDIKSSNIMLDAEFNPRLGDFGLARLKQPNESPESTLTAGTMGYLAPEYLQYGKATEKTDVYSYGVVVLELCSGRRPIVGRDRGGGNDLRHLNLVDWVWGLYEEDRIVEAADRRMNGEFDREEMERMLLVGLSCVNPVSVERPNMRRVLQVLNCEAGPLAVPRTKPKLALTSSANISIEEIVSD